MSRKVIFYTTDTGKCPVEEFIDNLEIKVVQKIVWTLKIIEEMDLVSKNIFQEVGIY